MVNRLNSDGYNKINDTDINKYLILFLIYIENLFDFIGVIILTIGIIKTGFLLKNFTMELGVESEKSMIMSRMEISESILLGLSFILAADVVKSIRLPDLSQLIRLAVLIGIRQLLTYYLDKEHKELKTLISSLRN